MRPKLLLATMLAAVIALPGCGSGDSEPTTTVERKEEKAEQVPELPRGWEEYVNQAQGFALGRPPGWAASENGGATQFLAPDELVAMFVSADRTDEALAVSPEEYATRTMVALDGFDEVDPGEPKKFKGHYDGAVIDGTATASGSGVKQNLKVIVLQRKGVVSVTAVIASNAKQDSEGETDQAVEAVRTLRTRPIG